MQHAYLRRHLREFLATDQARQRAAGAGSDGGDFEQLSLLGLTFADQNITNPLTPASQHRLAQLVANPDWPVCVAEWHDQSDPLCSRVHVDPTAIASPALVARIHWFQLPNPDEQNRYRGRHGRGQIAIYRDHAGEEFAEWSDDDPTKGGAWRVEQDLDLAEARRLVGAARAK